MQVATKELAQSLDFLKQAVYPKKPKNAGQKLFSRVRMEKKGRELHLEAACPPAWLSLTLPATFRLGKGAITTPAAMLAKVAKAETEPVVDISTLGKDGLLIKANGTSYQLSAHTDEGWPQKPERSQKGHFDMPKAAELARAITFCSPFVSPDITRFDTEHLLLDTPCGEKEQPRLVGTNGHVMAVVELPGLKLPKKVEPGRFTIPARTAALAVRLAKRAIKHADKGDTARVGVVWAPEALHMEFGRGETITLAASDVAYPDYRPVVPKQWTHDVTVSRAELSAALGRLKAFCPGGIFRGVVLTVRRRRLSLRTNDFGGGKWAEANMKARLVRGKAADCPARAYNHEYLKQVCKVFDGCDTLFLGIPEKEAEPMVVRSPEWPEAGLVIMGMRP